MIVGGAGSRGAGKTKYRVDLLTDTVTRVCPI
jgi:hypothetical protein